jgi:Kef-type K+ transport system membrane component KefB
VSNDLVSLVAIAIIAAAVPLIVGLLRLRVADVVLLIGCGILLGPEALRIISVTPPILLLSELGLAMLFFLAGLELEQSSVRGRSGRLAAAGWGISLLIAGVVSGLLQAAGIIDDFIGVSIALTSTALGTLLPVLRDSGDLTGPFGRFFMGAGAWGEFGPIIAIAVLLGSQSKFLALITLAAFAVIAVGLAVIPQRLRSVRITALIEQGHHTSAQTAVRLTMLVVILLLAVADGFGLDAVLGAFAAGIIVRRFSSPSSGSVLSAKVEAIGFGFLVPVFFITSGANLDIDSIIENPLLLALFFVLLLLVRGVPQFFIYRKALPDIRQRARFSLLVATGLPIIVAVTTLETQVGIMRPENAAALVGAGALSVLVFPLAAAAFGRPARDQARAANTE